MRNESQKSFDRGVQNQVDVWKEEKKNRKKRNGEPLRISWWNDFNDRLERRVAFGELCIQLILRLAKFFNDRRCYLKIRKMHQL